MLDIIWSLFLQEVTSKMLEIICIVSQDAQREIITCIPEVVDDSEHNVIAFDLKYVFTYHRKGCSQWAKTKIFFLLHHQSTWIVQRTD